MDEMAFDLAVRDDDVTRTATRFAKILTKNHDVDPEEDIIHLG